ncbi:hypothetical protein [Deinococcus hopiensis]|nr:hypothetical protein [Deinococcus hopiensis]
MRYADLTPGEIADHLHDAYTRDRRLGIVPDSTPERQALADYLGCHKEARDEAWEAWRTVLEAEGHDLEDAEYWLDVEFAPPCPE